MKNTTKRWIAATAFGLVVGTTGPASAATSTASCPGQELSVLGPALGRVVGQVLSFEARFPELEGRANFGVEVREFAHADRAACPEE